MPNARWLLRTVTTMLMLSPVVAGAQTANTTLYGRLNLDMEAVSGRQANGSDPRVFRINSNSSRLGVRGTESIGNGLSAVFQLESSVVADAGGGTLAGRETFVGLQGGWGTVRLGNFLTPYYDYIHSVFGNAPTFLTSILSTGALWAGGGGLTTATGSFQNRPGNSVRYDSPDISGLTSSVQYDTREAGHAGIVSLGAGYKNGPLQLGVAYTQNEDVRGPDLDDHAFSVTGGYDLRVLRLAGVYEQVKYGTPTGDLKRNFWGVSATAPAGPGTLYAFYGKALQGKGSACLVTAPGCSARIGGFGRGPDTDAQQYEISYTYPLSKRTVTYVGYVRVANAANAAYTFDINPYPVAAGAKPSGWILGTVHFF